MLADTTLLVDFLRGEKKAIKILESAYEVFTTEINIFELLVGANLSKTEKQKSIDAVSELISSIHVLPLERKGTLMAAEISAHLRLKGQKIEETDSLIAGIALSFGVDTIATANVSHFSRIRQLKVVGY